MPEIIIQLLLVFSCCSEIFEDSIPRCCRVTQVVLCYCLVFTLLHNDPSLSFAICDCEMECDYKTGSI